MPPEDDDLDFLNNDPEPDPTDPDPTDPDPDPTDPDPDPDPGPDPEPGPSPTGREGTSRAQARILAQQEALRAEKAAREADRRELEALRRQIADSQSRSTQQAQAEMLANMDPEERRQFLTDQRFNNMQTLIQQATWRAEESTDRMAFQARASSDPLVGRYEKRVEERLAEMRRNGTNAPRDTVLTYLIGEDVRAKQTRAAAGKQRAAGASRVKAAAGSPPRSRGDVSGRRSEPDPDSMEALEQRLGNQLL